MSSRRSGAWWRRRWCALALACGALAAWGVRLPATHRAHAHFPHVPPHQLAHLLADFSHQPYVGSWAVVEDHSNYTSWRYAVRYACGARCAGRALVATHDEAAGAAPAHGTSARAHRVFVALSACWRLPLLAWPSLCEEVETENVVWAGATEEGGGAWLASAARSSCDVLSALSGACASRLRVRHDAHVARVRAALGLPL